MSEPIVHVNAEAIHQEIRDLVRTSVEDTLNGLLDLEAEALTNAAKYERTPERQGIVRDSTTGLC